MRQWIVSLYLLSVLNAECNVACHWLQYDSGFYKNNMCYCIDHIDYNFATKNKPASVPSKGIKNPIGNHGYIPPIKTPEPINLDFLNNLGEYNPTDIY